MEQLLKLLALIMLGAIAGFLNIMAGGGSLLTLPFMIFLGLPPVVANGTNRVAILIQNIFAVARFHQFRVIPKGIIWLASGPAAVGAVLGAQIAVEIDELLFKRLLALVMVLVIGLTFFGPAHKQFRDEVVLDLRGKIALGAVFFFVGIYGGFIQGGIGFLIIIALTLVGYDLVKTNALKVLVVLVFTPFALAVFVANGQIDWVFGVALSAGNATGAWLATRVVVQRGHGFIRWVVMIAVAIFAVKLFLN